MVSFGTFFFPHVYVGISFYAKVSHKLNVDFKVSRKYFLSSFLPAWRDRLVLPSVVTTADLSFE